MWKWKYESKLYNMYKSKLYNMYEMYESVNVLGCESVKFQSLNAWKCDSNKRWKFEWEKMPLKPVAVKVYYTSGTLPNVSFVSITVLFLWTLSRSCKMLQTSLQ